MKNPSENKINDPRILQIIDANLDRAREGLRVLEDWSRFGLGRSDLVKTIKNYRNRVGAATTSIVNPKSSIIV